MGSRGARLLLIAIAIACAALLVVAIVRDPAVEFDESNMLRISARPIGEIVTILDLEQNFPLAYVLVHVIGLAGVTAIELVHYAGWLASVFVVWKLLGRFTDSVIARLALLLAMISVPYFFFYAFTIRMYGLASLALAIQLWCLIEPTRPRWQLRAAQLACTALHPIGIAATLATVLAEVVAYRRLVGPALAAAANLALVAVLVLTKSDLERIYFGSGVQYIAALDVGLADRGPDYFALSLYGPHDTVLAIAQHCGFVVTMFVAAHVFVSRRLYRDARYLVLAVAASPFLAVPIVLPHSFSEHHTAFFVVPIALFVLATLHEAWAAGWPVGYTPIGFGLAFGIVTGLPLIEGLAVKTAVAATLAGSAAMFAIPRAVPAKGRRTGALVLAVAIGCHALSVIGSIQAVAARHRYGRATCDAIDTLDADLLMTSYTTYNLMAHCATSQPRTYVLDRGTLLDTSTLSEPDILIEQAKRNGVVENPITVAGSLARVLPSVAARRPRRIGLVFPFADCGSSLRELAVPGYAFAECRDGVFVFDRR